MIDVLDRPAIELVEIEIDYNETAEGKDLDYNVEQIGKYPYVYFDGAIIESKDIEYLKIYNDKIIPRIDMMFADPSGMIVDENYPLDDSIVSIFINSTDENLMPIRMDFKIIEFYTIKGRENDNTLKFRLNAILNVDNLYLLNFESYEGTSFDVLRTISKNMSLGYASNIQSTNDSMVWINNSDYNYAFMNNIVSHSYISDETFLFGYVDFYYNFNYVDVETALTEDISDQEQVTDRNKVIKDGESLVTPLILTNHPDRNTTNLYISHYTIDNKSTKINLDYGYNHIVSIYNKSEDKYNGFKLDTISDVGSDSNNIILKGKTEGGLYDTHVKGTWMGKLDLDNVHENYLYAEIQNKNNLMFLQKLKMVIRLKKPNFNLFRFQKILVELYNLGEMEDSETETKNIDSPEDVGDDTYDDKIINKLSGEWLITAINYSFDKNEGNVQDITLIKRELTEKYEFKRKQKNTK